jgi:hypothetical protein
MRKLRKTGAVDEHGNLVTIPRLPSVAGANKPHGWNRWSAAEKAQHLLSMSLDRMHDYLSWPADELDPYRLAAQTQVVRVIAMVGRGRKVPPHVRARRARLPHSPAPATYSGHDGLPAQATAQGRRR